MRYDDDGEVEHLDILPPDDSTDDRISTLPPPKYGSRYRCHAADEIWAWLNRTHGRLHGEEQHPPPWDMSGWSDRQILDRANGVARELYRFLGYTVGEGYRFDQATHPQERMCWAMAEYLFEELLGTDLANCLSGIEDETDDDTGGTRKSEADKSPPPAKSRGKRRQK